MPGWGKSPGEGTGNPLQCSCPGNPMNRGARWATVHGVAKLSDTTQQLNNDNKLVLSQSRETGVLVKEKSDNDFFKPSRASTEQYEFEQAPGVGDGQESCKL